MQDILFSKIASLILLAFFSLLSAVLPVKLTPSGSPSTVTSTNANTEKKNNGYRQRHLKILMNFSGGVLLATCFLHLIPDVRHEFQESKNDDPGNEDNFPIAELTICLGYFAIYAIEELVEYWLCRRSCQQNHHHNHHPNEENLQPEVDCFSPVHSYHGAHREPDHQLMDCDKHNGLVEQSPLLIDRENQIKLAVDYGSTEGERAPEVADHDYHPNPESRSRIRGMMLIIGLSFHSILEGMAIGLQTEVSSVWMTFVAIAMHKFIVTFCVGFKVYQVVNRNYSYYAICMVTFCLVSPLGIAIGTALTSMVQLTDQDISQDIPLIAILQGLATGTLIYVTFFEILARNDDHMPPSLINFCSVFGGFLVIAGVHTMDGGQSEGGSPNRQNQTRTTLP